MQCRRNGRRERRGQSGRNLASVSTIADASGWDAHFRGCRGVRGHFYLNVDARDATASVRGPSIYSKSGTSITERHKKGCSRAPDGLTILRAVENCGAGTGVQRAHEADEQQLDEVALGAQRVAGRRVQGNRNHQPERNNQRADREVQLLG